MRDAAGFDAVGPSREAASLVRFGGLVLNLDACLLARDSGEVIPLTRGEFGLLRMFVTRQVGLFVATHCWTPLLGGVSRRSIAASTCWLASCAARSRLIRNSLASSSPSPAKAIASTG